MYKFEEMFVPIWDTDIVYGETFTMYRDENGEISAPFLYEPLEVVSVQSADLECTYEEGKDWYVKDGKIFLPESTSIPFMEYKDIYMDEPVEGKCFPYKEDGWLLFSEGYFFQNKQISVTYKCEKGGWKGYVPQFAGNLLPGTMKKLKEDKEIKIVLFGDSISAGSNASSRTMNNPFQPTWGNLLAERLRRVYGAKVDFVNNSVGGKCSKWGIETTGQRVSEEKPDLAIIGFGMNGCYKPEDLKDHVETIMKIAKTGNPNMEFIVISTSTPNPILNDRRAWFNNFQSQYYEALKELEGEGVAVANVRDVQKGMHSVKRFIDTTGNNVNHPNDFFIRVHAQIMATMLIEK